MEQYGGLERVLTVIAPYLAALVAAYAALSAVAWLAGELAGWLWTRRWAASDAGIVLGVLAHLLSDPVHPSMAWPASTRDDLAPAAVFYGRRLRDRHRHVP